MKKSRRETFLVNVCKSWFFKFWRILTILHWQHLPTSKHSPVEKQKGKIRMCECKQLDLCFCQCGYKMSPGLNNQVTKLEFYFRNKYILNKMEDNCPCIVMPLFLRVRVNIFIHNRFVNHESAAIDNLQRVYIKQGENLHSNLGCFQKCFLLALQKLCITQWIIWQSTFSCSGPSFKKTLLKNQRFMQQNLQI